MKNIYLDVETSGLNPLKHSIIQLSGLIEIDGELVEEFDYRIQPFPGEPLSKASLEICNITIEDLQTYPTPEVVYKEFCSVLAKYVNKFDKQDKFFLIGYNSRFDDEFLRSFFLKNADEYYGSWFWWPSLDVAVMAAILTKEHRHKFPNYKLETLAKYFGIEIQGNLHDALTDCKITRTLYKILSGE